MTEDRQSSSQAGISIDSAAPDFATNPGQSLSGESCSQGCPLHRPMRLASVTIIVGLLGLYGLIQFSPAIANVIPDRVFISLGLESPSHQCPLTESCHGSCAMDSAVTPEMDSMELLDE